MNVLTGDAIRQLGRRFGIRDLRLDADGVASLSIEGGRSLLLESRHGKLYLSLAFQVPASDEAMERLLAEAHPMRCRRFHVRAGFLRREGLALLCVGIPDETVSVSRLSEAYEFLEVGVSRTGGGSWA